MIKTALKEYGTKEIVGKEDNKTIVNYAKESGFKWINDDETPWCSIFINWVAMKAGYERSGKANARSWLDVGEAIENPSVGDIIVFKRGNNGWSGHVALFISIDGDYAWVLGGNQSNQVKISKYNLSDLLGYRRLKKL